LGKIRVYELAKELNVESKKMMDYLKKQGFNITNHMSVMDENAEAAARRFFGKSAEPSGFRPVVKRIKKEVVEAERAHLAEEAAKVAESAAPAVAKAEKIEEAAKPAAPAQAEVKAEEKSAPNAEAPVKPEIKTEAKQEVKLEVKSEVKPELKAEPKAEPKAEVKPEIKPEQKAESKPQTESKAEVKSEVKPEAKSAQKPEQKPEQKSERKPEQKSEQKVEVKAEAPAKEAARTQSEPYSDAADMTAKAATKPQNANQNENRSRQDNRNQGNNGNNRRDDKGDRNNNRSDNRNNRDNRDNRDSRDNRDNRDNRNNSRDNNRFDKNDRNRQGDRNQGNRSDNRNNNRDERNDRFDKGDRNDRNNNRGDNRNNRDNRGGRNDHRSKPAQTPEVVYAPASAPAKPDSRRPDKKRNDRRDQNFGNENLSRMEKSNKNNRVRNKYKEQKKQKVEIAPATPKKVVIGETIILSELAKSMHKTASELIKKLFEMGIMATINQSLDSDTAILLADEFGVEIEVRQEKIVEILEDDQDNPRDLKERPPVVTVMGHVDHGKTSLLDAIRNTKVTTTEAGGITQHIGAYQVEIQGKKITFLDTPGHEAFTAMRARGAQVTDISILVVAADDGIMPQTVEAINHSKAAGVPIIVAINKIDKPGANVDKVMQELTEYELIPEAWGGDTIMVPVSAKKGEGIETLLEMILLVAEVAELRANPKRQARGTVIEAKLDRARGPLATLLIQKGTLKIGETIVAGSVFGKIRAMYDDTGKSIRSAGPSMPVEILGFSEVPEAGEIFIAIKDERDARYAAQIQAIKKREEEMRKSSRVSLDDLFAKISEGEVKELNIIIKADVRGSVEAISQSLEKLGTDEVKVRIIHVGVGAINESDVMLADASNAIIIGFNVRPDAQTRKAAELAMVDMRLYSVIYDAIEDVKKAMAGLLEPEFKETWLGQVEVRNTFKVPKVGLVAGGYVLEGKITRNSEVRIIRDGVVIFQGKLASLKRFKDDAKEVAQGFECGIGIENYNDIKEGDIIEAFIMEETEREL
jgi:translation initiation factor IF-2